MTDQAMSPLRRRMIEDMTVRNFVAKTQTDYIRRVTRKPSSSASSRRVGRVGASDSRG